MVPGISDLSNIYDDYLNQIILSVGTLRKQVSEDQIQALVQDLHEYPNVVVMGHMQSANTAMTFQQNLFCAGKWSDSLIRPSEQIDYFYSPSYGTEKTLILIFSVTGVFFKNYFPNGEQLPPPGKAKLYMLTCNPDFRAPDGIHAVLNTCTGKNIEGANLSLELLSNIICFQYHALSHI